MPPMAMQSDAAQRPSQSTIEDHAYYTPAERRSSAYSRPREPEESEARRDGAELDQHSPANRLTAMSLDVPPRPMSASPTGVMRQLISDTQRQHNEEGQNPFSSAEDDEIADVISPIAPPTQPSKAVERVRSMPIVHYPSWSEVSDFDFAGDGKRRSWGKSGGSWHPWRERKDGRHELA